MPRRRLYANNAEQQAAYRRRQQFQASGTARLIALQEEAAQEHVVTQGRALLPHGKVSAAQRRQQDEMKERDMMDALWVLQTLIADFGYDEVYTHVLQHLRPLPGSEGAPPPRSP
jgi:hypothetical protein